MAKTIALLRGINVGGKTVKMDRLKALLEGMGLTRVSTYIQSGNVLFDTIAEPPEEIESRIGECLRTSQGFEVPVLLLSLEELNDILAANPYDGRVIQEGWRLHITLLGEVPSIEAAEKLTIDLRSSDEFALIGRAAYILCKHGYNETPYSNNFFEKKLKMKATTRNVETMTKLAALAES